MALLHQKRARFRGELNEYLSATRSLPPEVLTEIFRLSACNLDSREPQLYSVKIWMLLRLGSICSHWRRIVWSAAFLWTTCLLEQDYLAPPFIVALVFSNAGRGCVSVEVDLDNLPHESMLLIFQRHRAQIRALRVYTSYDDSPCNGWDRVAHYFSEPTEWPNLTELWVCSPPDVDFPDLMFQVPGVDSFHYCRRKQDNLVWCAPMHQLTVLRLQDIRIDQCLYLLFHCPGLIEFHYSSEFAECDPFLFTPETIFSPSRTPKNCPNLRIFQWRVLSEAPGQLVPSIRIEDWNRFLFSSIRFPNLEKLSWGVPHADLNQPWPTKPVDSVLVNEFMPSLSRITALDWDVPCPSYSYFSEVFSQTNLSSLQQLYLLLDHISEAVPWLEALSIDQRFANCFLPRLETIYIKLRHALDETIIFDTPFNCLQSRRLLLLEDESDPRCWDTIAFLLCWKLLPRRAPLNVEQHLMDGLQGLVNGGLGFDVAPLSEFDRIYLPDRVISNRCCHIAIHLVIVSFHFFLPSFFTLVTSVSYICLFSGISVMLEHIKLYSEHPRNNFLFLVLETTIDNFAPMHTHTLSHKLCYLESIPFFLSGRSKSYFQFVGTAIKHPLVHQGLQFAI